MVEVESSVFTKVVLRDNESVVTCLNVVDVVFSAVLTVVPNVDNSAV